MAGVCANVGTMEQENVSASSSSNSGQKPGLLRVLGLWDIVSIVIGGVIGSGIFLVPMAMAGHVQSPLLMLAVWVVGGLLSFFGALSFAELGAAFPEAGGIYVYLREAYGHLVSFLFGWTLFLVIDAGAVATLAVAFSKEYLPQLIPNMSGLTIQLVAAGMIIFLMAANYLGARWGANLQNLLTVIKFGALIIICGVIFIFAKGSTANFVSPQPPHFNMGMIGAFGAALIASLWAYKGWEAATYSGAETKRPERNLPLGLLIGTAVCVIIYVIANLAYLYVMPVGEIAQTPYVASVAIGKVKFIGSLGAALTAVVILFSIMGAANQNLLCSPRVYYSMARDGLFFKSLAGIHPKFHTPHLAIIALGAWSIVLSLWGSFEKLFTYVILGEWIFFGMTAAAVIVLRKKRPDLHRPYKTFGYPVTPIIFILGSLFILGLGIKDMAKDIQGYGQAISSGGSAGQIIKSILTNPVTALFIIVLGIPAYAYWQRRNRKKAAKPS
jgi:APA family basic amino acid/polyamine antiporter